jgi:hypothetical protein
MSTAADDLEPSHGVAEGDFMPVDTYLIAHNIVSLGHMWALKRGRFRNLLTIDQYIAEQQRYLEKDPHQGVSRSDSAATEKRMISRSRRVGLPPK